jgi:hypothetical protein
MIAPDRASLSLGGLTGLTPWPRHECSRLLSKKSSGRGRGALNPSIMITRSPARGFRRKSIEQDARVRRPRRMSHGLTEAESKAEGRLEILDRKLRSFTRSVPKGLGSLFFHLGGIAIGCSCLRPLKRVHSNRMRHCAGERGAPENLTGPAPKPPRRNYSPNHLRSANPYFSNQPKSRFNRFGPC